MRVRFAHSPCGKAIGRSETDCPRRKAHRSGAAGLRPCPVRRRDTKAKYAKPGPDPISFTITLAVNAVGMRPMANESLIPPWQCIGRKCICLRLRELSIMIPGRAPLREYTEEFRLDEIVATHNDAFRKSVLPEQVDFSPETLARMQDGRIPNSFPRNIVEHIRSDHALRGIYSARNGWGTYWLGGERYFWSIRYHDSHDAEIDNLKEIRVRSKELYRTIIIESEAELIETDEL